MDCFSCFRDCFGKPRAASSSADDAHPVSMEKGLEKTISSGSDTLLADEGANYQQDLWQLALQTKLLQTQQRTVPIDLELHDWSTPEAFLQTLISSYNTSGFASLLPRVRQTFLAIEPFVTAINTMTQSNMIAGLVWGSLTVIFQVGAEHAAGTLAAQRNRN